MTKTGLQEPVAQTLVQPLLFLVGVFQVCSSQAWVRVYQRLGEVSLGLTELGALLLYTLQDSSSVSHDSDCLGFVLCFIWQKNTADFL